jgi:hypothetical protein
MIDYDHNLVVAQGTPEQLGILEAIIQEVSAIAQNVGESAASGHSPGATGPPPWLSATQSAKPTPPDQSVTPAQLVEPPKLRFLAWQDEWQTSQPGAARHPDGSPVTDSNELGWLGQVRPSRMFLGRRQMPPGTRFLHLWFSYPAAERLEINGIFWLDGEGKPMQLGAHPPWGLQPHDPNDRNGNLGWFTATLSPGEGKNLPSRVTVQLSYTAGPLERSQDFAVTPSHAVSMSLEGGSMLSNFGQNMDGRAFLAIEVDVVNTRGRRFDVVAVARDGHEIPSKRGGRSGMAESASNIRRFEFTLPLAEVAKFRIGTRPLRTNEWHDVVLPGN